MPSLLQEGDVIFISSTSGQSEMLLEAQTRALRNKGDEENLKDAIWTHVGVVMQDKDGRYGPKGAWGVFEASAKTMWTPIEKFVAKSNGQQVSVKRVDPKACSEWAKDQPPSNKLITCNIAPNIESLRSVLQEKPPRGYFGLPYDVRFEPGSDKIYCSELVDKAFLKAYGIKLAPDRPFSEMLGIGPGQSWRELPADSFVRAAIDSRFDGGRTFRPETPAVPPVEQYQSKLFEPVYECRMDVQPEVGRGGRHRRRSE